MHIISVYQNNNATQFVGYGDLDVPLQKPNEKARYICESNTNDSQFVEAIINRPLQGIDEQDTFVFEITFFIYDFLVLRTWDVKDAIPYERRYIYDVPQIICTYNCNVSGDS